MPLGHRRSAFISFVVHMDTLWSEYRSCPAIFWKDLSVEAQISIKSINSSLTYASNAAKVLFIESAEGESPKPFR
jgi:hypothetical protein